MIFQSTPPGWEATIFGVGFCSSIAFQSTPPGWEATQTTSFLSKMRPFQSTPPGWEATIAVVYRIGMVAISIHASRVGGDKYGGAWDAVFGGFQSTPPGWEATFVRRTWAVYSHFNPRLPGGRRQPTVGFSTFAQYFNPRLPGGRRPM